MHVGLCCDQFFGPFIMGFEVGFDSGRCCPVFPFDPMTVFWP